MARRALRLAAFCRDGVPLLAQRADGSRALADVERLVETERWCSFDSFHRTSERLAADYEAAGVTAEIDAIATGTGLGTGRWVIQEAADLHHARAEVVEPVQLPLLDYAQNPWHVARWSNSTPAGGVRGELVVIDEAEAIAALPRRGLAGRVLLTRVSPNWRGALWADKAPIAVICDTPAGSDPTATAWLSLGWGGLPWRDGLAHPVVLAVSPHRGDALRRLLALHGRLVIALDCRVHRYVGSHDVVSGVLPGGADPQDEVWAVAHSGEPGAADNASGVAACLESARLLSACIADGALPRPKRTIRWLHAYECYGFFAYLEQQSRLQPPLAGVVADCVGLRPELCGRRLEWHDTVPMSATFVNELGARLLRAAMGWHNPGYRLHQAPFVSTSDTLLGDPQYGFPCPWLATYHSGAARGYDAYHSSADTPAVLDPAGLALAATGLAAYLYHLADGDHRDAGEWAALETRRLQRDLARPEVTAEWAAFRREQQRQTLTRLRRWWWGGRKAQLVREWQRQLPGGEPTPPATGDIPRRTAPLSPTLENTPAAIADALRGSKLRDWALFWADGRRSLPEIAALLRAETGAEVSVEQVTGYFAALAELGYVALLPEAESVGAEQLTADLLELGLVPGSDVVVHSSLSAIGPVRGGAETVIDALLAALGPAGTLLMPSFHHFAAQVYNPLTTPTLNGAIADAFWRRDDVLRSDHPSHAVAAVGPRAAAYLRDHARHGVWTAASPLGRLVHSGGYVLSLGVDHTRSTVYHIAEMSLGAGCLDAFGSRDDVVGEDGQVIPVPSLAWRAGQCPVPPALLDQTLRERGVQRHGRVGQADATLVPAMEIFKARRAHLHEVCPTCPVRPQPRGLAAR